MTKHPTVDAAHSAKVTVSASLCVRISVGNLRHESFAPSSGHMVKQSDGCSRSVLTFENSMYKGVPSEQLRLPAGNQTFSKSHNLTDK